VSVENNRDGDSHLQRRSTSGTCGLFRVPNHSHLEAKATFRFETQATISGPSFRLPWRSSQSRAAASSASNPPAPCPPSFPGCPCSLPLGTSTYKNLVTLGPAMTGTPTNSLGFDAAAAGEPTLPPILALLTSTDDLLLGCARESAETVLLLVPSLACLEFSMPLPWPCSSCVFKASCRSRSAMRAMSSSVNEATWLLLIVHIVAGWKGWGPSIQALAAFEVLNWYNLHIC